MTYIERFESYLLHEKRFSFHTVTAYIKDVEQFYDLSGIETDGHVREVNHRVMRNFLVDLVEKGLENTSVNRKLSSVKTFFRFLRQVNEITINPAVKVKGLKKKKTLPQFVPEKQLWDKEIFSEEVSEYDQLLVELIMELFYQTGIRLSELIELKNVNISSNQIKVVGKRSKERIIPIAPALFHLIQKFRLLKSQEGMDGELLIVTKNGKKLNPKFVYSKVNYYLGKATNLSKKSPHVLRHTFATHMLNNGASLETIKKILGHADLSSTQIYTHNSFKQIKTIYEQSHPRGVRR